MEFKSWLDNGKQTDFSHFLSYEEYALLNMISRTYHSGFGYHLNEQYATKQDILCNSNHDIIIEIIDDENEPSNSENETKMILFDLELTKKTSKAYLLKHKTIIIRLDAKNNGSNWREKPCKVKKTWFRENKVSKAQYWYELPSDVFISKAKSEKGKKIKLIGSLSSRKYIHVIDNFEEIELRSEEKESQLTIDDILFACRGLCADDTRSIQSFNVLSDNGSVLKLKVNIDNWST